MMLSLPNMKAAACGGILGLPIEFCILLSVQTLGYVQL